MSDYVTTTTAAAVAATATAIISLIEIRPKKNTQPIFLMRFMFTRTIYVGRSAPIERFEMESGVQLIWTWLFTFIYKSIIQALWLRHRCHFARCTRRPLFSHLMHGRWLTIDSFRLTCNVAFNFTLYLGICKRCCRRCHFCRVFVFSAALALSHFNVWNATKTNKSNCQHFERPSTLSLGQRKRDQ